MWRGGRGGSGREEVDDDGLGVGDFVDDRNVEYSSPSSVSFVK